MLDKLATILIVYRDLHLYRWGIPYEMRSDCGQQPRDLENHPNRGWIYLGVEGWYGNSTAEETCTLTAFTEMLKALDQLPGNWYEWGRVELPQNWRAQVSERAASLLAERRAREESLKAKIRALNQS